MSCTKRLYLKNWQKKRIGKGFAPPHVLFLGNDKPTIESLWILEREAADRLNEKND